MQRGSDTPQVPRQRLGVRQTAGVRAHQAAPLPQGVEGLVSIPRRAATTVAGAALGSPVSPLGGPCCLLQLSSDSLAPGHCHCDQLALQFPTGSTGFLAYSKVSIQRLAASAPS